MHPLAKFSLLTVLLSSGLSGCGGAPSAPATASTPNSASTPQTAVAPKITGTWQGQMEINPAAAKDLTPEKIANLQQMKLEMTFQENGTLQLRGETNGQPYTSQNRWKLISATGSKVTIESTDAGGQTKPIDLLFDNADAFHMPLQTEVADLGAMKFQRLR
jgi:hypothetical protein